MIAKMSFGTSDLWATFPDQAQTKKIFGDLHNLILGGASTAPPTPYHFTLVALRNIYITLLGEEPVEQSSIWQPAYENAKASPLRAIAYFSWEKAAQMFLTRRVYPMYFDFLSYSHVPAGWGALGVMLKELDREGRRYKDRVYTGVSDIRRNPTFFPYLQEAMRLDYTAVVVLPLFIDAEPDHATLRGACVFYLQSSALLPARTRAKERLRDFASQMATAVREHERKIDNSELSKNWHRDLRMVDNYAAELHISIHPSGRGEVLDDITDAIIRSLSGHDLCSLARPSDEGTDEMSRTIMIAVRDGIDHKIARTQILNAVGHACAIADDDHFFSYRLNGL
jgi:hypothetical protein